MPVFGERTLMGVAAGVAGEEGRERGCRKLGASSSGGGAGLSFLRPGELGL